MAKQGEVKQREKKIKKVTEKRAKLNAMKSLFYPSEHGGEEAAYKKCLLSAVDKTVYWDKKINCWYHYV